MVLKLVLQEFNFRKKSSSISIEALLHKIQQQMALELLSDIKLFLIPVPLKVYMPQVWGFHSLSLFDQNSISKKTWR